jgi:hypothetical protein
MGTWCKENNFALIAALIKNSLLSRTVKIQIHNNLVLPVVLYGYESWSLTLRQKHRLRAFEGRVLRIILAPRMRQELGGNYVMSFINCTLREV